MRRQTMHMQSALDNQMFTIDGCSGDFLLRAHRWHKSQVINWKTDVVRKLIEIRRHRGSSHKCVDIAFLAVG